MSNFEDLSLKADRALKRDLSAGHIPMMAISACFGIGSTQAIKLSALLIILAYPFFGGLAALFVLTLIYTFLKLSPIDKANALVIE